ncbi:MAG: methyl-accepting chemotaxis protein [Acidimicrobiales bacterium]|nr:CZB domain-containing protein [Acidimicrobiales bacterium]
MTDTLPASTPVADEPSPAFDGPPKRRLVDVLAYENERLVEGLGNIQANLAESVAFNGEVLQEFGEVEREFDSLAADSRRISEEIDSLTNIVVESKDNTETMNELVKNITKLLQVIVNISERTNLLALNATIEAARAGTAGKGFSVVANEVKNLSNQTKSAAEDITKAVEEINSQSLRVTESMDNSAEMCEDIRTIISEFDTRLHATNAANQRAMNKIYSTKDMIFMVLAKLDHVIWKTNTYRSVLHREQMFDFVDHHSCRLGKWYTTGEGRTGFGHVNSYRELERPHSVVHNGTKRVFEMLDYDENDCEELEAALKVMEEGSDGVFRVLDRMLSEKR